MRQQISHGGEKGQCSLAHSVRNIFVYFLLFQALQALLADDSKFGFIVMDGNGALFGILQGNTRDVLHKFTVDLPKKHGRGGQSALRFARLRVEKRHNYVRKVAEEAVRLFITNDKPNISGLVMAGSADFKTELSQSDMFDPVSRKILATNKLSLNLSLVV